MEVFHCEVAANEIIRSFNGPGLAEGKPPELEACRKVIGAWAMGATVGKKSMISFNKNVKTFC